MIVELGLIILGNAIGGATLLAACSSLIDVCAETYGNFIDENLSNETEARREDALYLKSEFQRVEIYRATVQANHTHGNSAANRTTGTKLMLAIGSSLGKDCYFYQGSGANVRAGQDYSRSYFWAKDLMAPHKAFVKKPDSIICIVDVDYYIDMHKMLSDNFQPYLIYTLVPQSAARSTGDYGYFFDKNGHVHYHVSGGGWYPSPLWDWDGDCLKVYSEVLGVRTGMSVYAIERRQIDEDHQLLLLVPLYQTSWIHEKWLIESRLQARELQRFNPVVGDQFVRFYITKTDGRYVATGKVNEYISNVCNVFDDSTVRSTGLTISGKLTLANVKSKLTKATEDDAQRGLEVLLEFHRKGLATDAHVSIVDSVRRYQYVNNAEDYDPDAKQSMHSFMRPLVDKAFAPDKCLNNDKRMIAERADKVRDKVRVMNSFQSLVIDEFLELLIPVKHQLHPVDLETVYERQNRPSQRAILNEAENSEANRNTNQFMKNEAYASPNDPRIISIINGVDKREWSKYVYEFTDSVMKHQDWYGFGKSQREIAARVATICGRAIKTVGLGDFSRMDGRHGNLLTELEQRAFVRAFRKEYTNEILKQMNSNHHLNAVTSHGHRSQTQFERLSGVADTSGSNTLDTAFITFFTYRSAGLDKKEAWDKLGIFAGDDTATEDLDPVLATKCAASFGQVLEVQVIGKNKPGINFLARRYGPDVWSGDDNSCCDIVRQISKFHTTASLPSNITRETKLQEKSFAFQLSDKNTPIIGEFVNRALELFPMSGSFENKLNMWGVQEEEEKQYRNERADWMIDIVNEELAGFDYEAFQMWLTTTDKNTIFETPCFIEKPEARPKPGTVVVDEDILETPEKETEPAEKPETEKRATVKPPAKDPKQKFRGRKPREKKNEDNSHAKKRAVVNVRLKGRTSTT